MFTRIEKKLSQRLNSIQQEKNNQDKINNTIQSFLSSYGYPQTNIGYDSLENKITIETSSKVFANEIVLRLGDIAKILKKEGIKVSKIIIR